MTPGESSGEPPASTGEPRITLAFHPDWPCGEGTVLDAIADGGVYVSQFVTGTSNGGLTAHPGGERWRWESRLFDGRYDGAAPADRPVYGAVEVGERGATGYGGSPRFGSAYLRLRPDVTARATFCFPDSVFEPAHHGGPDRLAELLALRDATDLDDLDRYVEAQVHGGVRLAPDVETLVLDPCFHDTPVEAAARRAGCPVAWHPGYRVETAGLDEDYRGSEPLALARSLGPVLVPSVLGDAARTGAHDPQTLKRVWHLLARFGRAGRTVS